MSTNDQLVRQFRSIGIIKKGIQKKRGLWYDIDMHFQVKDITKNCLLDYDEQL